MVQVDDEVELPHPQLGHQLAQAARSGTHRLTWVVFQDAAEGSACGKCTMAPATCFPRSGYVVSTMLIEENRSNQITRFRDQARLK
jgi:hypothetical protein